eukprot:TRINITY_DN11453_c1_g1_i1.p1 TRINITY_DN11453_c1_g1~~TRINITY_DN11453_c1_g1_i1.p1  ORF type:complete len:153 (+),score=33.50 TRINITY_DN11453_c1_g1_i1:499-957(+)
MSTQAVIEAIEQPEDNSGLKGQIAKLQAEASNRLEAVHQLRVESSTKSKQIEALEADIQKLRVQLYDQTAELEKFRRIEAKRKAARKKKHKRAKKANKKRQFKATPFKDDGKAKVPSSLPSRSTATLDSLYRRKLNGPNGRKKRTKSNRFLR